MPKDEYKSIKKLYLQEATSHLDGLEKEIKGIRNLLEKAK